MKTAGRVAPCILGALVLAAAGVVRPASALTLGGNESVGDGVLNGDDGTIRTQTVDGATFWWADTNGDGTAGDPATPGLNLAGFNLTRTADSKGIALNLSDGTSNGSITNGGDISTSGGANPTGPIVITNAAAVLVRQIDTRRIGGYYNSGSIQILGVGDVAVSNLVTSDNTQNTEGVGGITIRQTGNFAATNIQNNTFSGGRPGALSFTGESSGAFSAGRILHSGAVPGSVLIDRYQRVAVGASGIDARDIGAGSAGANGGVCIRNIGSGGVTVGGSILAPRDSTGAGTGQPGGVVITNIAGGVTVGDIDVHIPGWGTSGWHDAPNAPVTVIASGAVRLGNLSTYFGDTNLDGHAAGPITVTSTAGAVTLGTVDTRNGTSGANSRAGNATISAGGHLTITGSVKLGAPYGSSRCGTLSLTTTPGSRGMIYVGDDPGDTLDCTLLSGALFDGDLRLSHIRGALTNFSLTAGSGDGTMPSPYVTTQTVLRTPANQRIYYTYVPGGHNGYLGGSVYRVADLAGNAGQGGLLMPPVAKGTVVFLR
jgi:hypothetical protein